MSWTVLRAEPKLLVLPLISFVSMAFIAAIYAGGIYTAGWWSSSNQIDVVELIPLYLLVTYVGVLANATIIEATALHLDGRPVSLGRAWRRVERKCGRLLAWSIASTTVGIAIRAAEERVPFVGRIVLAIVGATWSVVTFFVLPVLLFEDVSAIEAVKRSSRLFKQRWGSQLIGNASISLIITLFGAASIVISVAIMVFVPWLGVSLLVLSLVAMVLVSSALSGIFNTALYRYAVGNPATGPFQQTVLAESFRQRRRSLR